jgi:hypothetical protein
MTTGLPGFCCYDRVVVTGTLPTVCCAGGMTRSPSAIMCASSLDASRLPKLPAVVTLLHGHAVVVGGRAVTHIALGFEPRLTFMPITLTLRCKKRPCAKGAVPLILVIRRDVSDMDGEVTSFGSAG